MLKRWLHNYKLILSDIVTSVGIFWLLVEIASYSTSEQIDQYIKNIPIFLLVFSVIFLVSLFKNKPKTSFSYQLRGKDNFIEINVGDAFKNSGSLVIPINDNFDVSLGGNVKKAKSLQNKLIIEYYAGKEEHLASDISKVITLPNIYDIGKTIEIEQNNKTFYLLVNSRKTDKNRVISTLDDFLLSLSKLWEYIALESGRDTTVTIPLISTNHGRISNLNRSSAIKEIIQSYIESSKYLNIADKLIISIFPDDLNKGSLDLDEIDEYLKFSCKHFRMIKLSEKVEGEGISASTVETINN